MLETSKDVVLSFTIREEYGKDEILKGLVSLMDLTRYLLDLKKRNRICKREYEIALKHQL